MDVGSHAGGRSVAPKCLASGAIRRARRTGCSSHARPLTIARWT
ncbi:hypothetical protein DB32_006978 [Sandaracinus amylolyticus]|uniref:Uncharacterized protein n=1 Tax=Sandaracinus amylolyticus TaxID=927083 RepID=A0A0F6SH50_9BACT|nr:hypothetical protein DB32_006978 [Sandaracinus amylolyticus]